MAPKLKLVYFDVRGRGELIRFILHAANVDFEDERIQFPDWPARKPESPNGQLPYLEMEGKKYPESAAIARYLAKKHNLAGKDDIEALNADIIHCMVEDLRTAYVKFKFDSTLTEDQKKSLLEKFSTDKAPAHCKRLEECLSESKSGFLVGKNVTIADLAVADVSDQLEKEIPGIFDKYPKVTEHIQKIKSLPRIAPYLAERKDTPI